MPFSAHPHAVGHHAHPLRDHPIRAMYVGDTIRSFGAGLFAVFAPVYLFTIFSAAEFALPIAWVMAYYAVYWCVALVTMYQALKIYPRVGFRFVVITSVLAGSAQAYFLILAEHMGVGMVALAVVFGGIASGVFWPAYHILFARSASDGHRGQAIGTRSAFIRIAKLLAPALGGFIIVRFGFSYVLWAFIAARLMSALPYSLVDMRDGHRGGIRPLLREFMKPEGRKTGLGFISWGTSLPLSGFAWPILLFLLGITYEQLGFLVTGASLVAVIVIFFFGKFSDKHDRQQLLNRSSKGYAGAWVLRILTAGPWTAFIADTLANITGGISAIPIDSQAYDRLSGEHPNEQVHLIMLREIGINGGKILGALLIIGLLILGVSLKWIMIVGIPAALLMPMSLTWASANKVRTGQPEAAPAAGR